MSVNIQLDKDWKIKSDERNWILAKKRTRKGKITYEGTRFYSNLNSLLEGYVEARLRGVEAHNIQDLIDTTNELKRQLKTTLEGIELK
jgi:hypothetical protein